MEAGPYCICMAHVKEKYIARVVAYTSHMHTHGAVCTQFEKAGWGLGTRLHRKCVPH